jgi:hypothetical protein
LICVPFADIGIQADTVGVVDAICRLTSRQPCYIQALCTALVNTLSRSPGVVDVVIVKMVEDIVEQVVIELGQHFLTMYRNLAEICDPVSLDRLMRNQGGITRGMLLPQGVGKAGLGVTLEAVPGIRVKSGKKVGEGEIECVGLFHRWYLKENVMQCRCDLCRAL